MLKLKKPNQNQILIITLGAVLLLMITFWYISNMPKQAESITKAGDCVPTSGTAEYAMCCFKHIQDANWQQISCQDQGIDGLAISPIFKNKLKMSVNEVYINKAIVVSDSTSPKGIDMFRKAFKSTEGNKRNDVQQGKYVYWSTPGCVPIESSSYCIPEHNFIDLRNLEDDKYAIDVELKGKASGDFVEHRLILFSLKKSTQIDVTKPQTTQVIPSQTTPEQGRTNVVIETPPESTECSTQSTQSKCIINGCYWWNVACHDFMQPVASFDVKVEYT